MRADRAGRAGGSNALVMGALALLLFSTVACADDPAQDDGAAQQTTGAAGSEQHEYFGFDQFVGDESLLVLSAENAAGIREGDVVQVSGIVEQFRPADYRDRYGLLDDGVHRTYSDEEFLVAQNVRQDVPVSSGTTTPSN